MNNIDNYVSNTMEKKVIYVYKKNYAEEAGYLKIGDASIDKPNANLEDNSDYLRKISEKRIREYELSSPITILYATVAVKNNWQYFRDHQVHEVLVRSGYPKITKGKSTEWFEISLETAIEAINAVKNGKKWINKPQNLDFKGFTYRKEQEDAITKTIEVFKTKNDMLWNAKMRFGKTCCALEVVKRSNYRKTLVFTHRPIVDKEWYDNFKNVFFESNTNYIYTSKQYGEDISKTVSSQNDHPFVCFTSLQDLRGSSSVGGDYDKNDEIFSTDWDFVIIDEAHEGTKTELAEKVIELVVSKDTKVLKLSGTPFNLMYDYDDSQIFTWDYVMEQSAKEEWDKNNSGDSNPYGSLPKMNMFTYELGKLIKNDAFIDLESSSFNFAEFFRVEDDKFAYEKEVWDFLNVISKSEDYSKASTNMPFSTAELRQQLRHTLWTLPSRKAGQLLEIMLKKHPVFCNYNIANLIDDGDSTDDMKKIKTAITNKPEETFSITLTVRKGTVGVTVREWTAVFVLNNTESASNYLQTIFRVQSPYTGKNGVKENVYVFDFAPDRSLKMIAESVRLNIKKGSINSYEQEKQMRQLLHFLPVIGIEGNTFKEFNVKSMLIHLKRASAEIAVRRGFDDASIYSDELYRLSPKDLEEFNKLYAIVGKTKQSKLSNKLKINDQGLTQEEWKKAEEGEKKSKKKRTKEEQEAIDKKRALNKQRESLIQILRGISIRIPLMIYGMDINIKEDVSIDEFINKVDDISWKEFMSNGVTKEEFIRFKKYYDADIFIEAGRRIRKAALAADKLPFEERIEKITGLFNCFKNPDKETVLTPWRVVNMHLGETIGGYNFYSKEYSDDYLEKNEIRYINYDGITNRVFNNNSRILEINSKTGLYPLYMAYTLYKKRYMVESVNWDNYNWVENDKKLWDEVLENNIFVLCKTPMAKTITYRTIKGYEKNNKIFSNLLYVEDLIDKTRIDYKDVMKTIKNYFGGTDMRFDAVVGNPPYQETVREASNGNNANTVDIFQYFQQLALSLGTINTLIYPAKELQRGKMTLMDQKLIKVRIYNGSNKETEKNIPGEPSVFGDAVRRIPGDVGIFLWDNEHPSEKISYQDIEIERTDKIMPVRKEYFKLAKQLETFAGTAKSYTIKKCCESNFVEKNPGSIYSEVDDRNIKAPVGYTKVITNDKGGSGGKARWYYIRTKDLDFVQPEVYKVVISSAFPNEAFKNPKNVEILKDDEMFGRTKLSLYYSENEKDAINYVKYISTGFVRAIAEMTPLKFMYYLPDFNDIKDKINWDQNLKLIDHDLYALFGIEIA